MKRSKSKVYWIGNIPKDCLIIIFLFLDGSSIFNIMLTCKHFEFVVNNTTFWKLCLKENKSWKELCKKYVTNNKWVNFDERSKDGLLNQIKNSPISEFFNNLCTKVVDMGYWGIYFKGRIEKLEEVINNITITRDIFVILKWDYIQDNRLRYFDFYRDNKNNRFFNNREIYDKVLSYYKESDFYEIQKYLKRFNINIWFHKKKWRNRKTLELEIGWEKKEQVKEEKKSSYCIIL